MLDTSFFGGAGDQRGTAIAYQGGDLYLSGNVQPETYSASDVALVLKYDMPTTSGATPLWSRTFASGTGFYGIGATNEGVYAVGSNRSILGDNEVKSIAAKFTLDGSNGSGLHGSVWVQTPVFYANYYGFEYFTAATTADVGGTTYLYATGSGQPWSYSAATFAKYDTAGNLLAKVGDPSRPLPGGSPTVPNFSVAYGITELNDNIYSAGRSSYGDTTSAIRPTLWKHNANLVSSWQVKDSSVYGLFNSVTSFGGAVYAVGYTYVPATSNSEDYLIQKFDETGNRLWSTNIGGAGTDILTGVVGMGSSLYAVGYTASSGAGGKDMVILEIDPANGNILSTTLFGGAQDDQANGITTDGTDLYVVGESRSFAQGGNAIGQNDLVLLHYAAVPPNCHLAPKTSHEVAPENQPD